MAIAADLVPIERPCPVDLDPKLSDGSRRSWHCGHCQERVHVLSSMTEDEARDFMAKNDGKKICVTYLERADGTIVFRKPPPPRLVPASALSPRRVALGLSLSAALAACTPTERTEPTTVGQISVQVQAEAKSKAKATTEDAPCESGKDDTKMSDLVQKYKEDAQRVKDEPEPDEPEPEPEPEVAPEVFVPRPGGITARPLPPATPTPPVTMKRGGIGG